MRHLLETRRYLVQANRKKASVVSALTCAAACAVSLLVNSCTPRAALPPSNEAMLHNNLGVALMDVGPRDPQYFSEAVKEFDAAVRVSPDFLAARINLGIAHYYASQKEQALATLESVAKDAPDNPHVNYMLGLIKEADGNYQDAAAHFLKVTRQDPQEPHAWYHLGYCYSKEGRLEEAIDPFRRAAALSPYQRAFRYSLFMALNRAGKKAEAQAEFDNFKMLERSSIRLVDASKNSLEYLKQGRYAEAIASPGNLATPSRAASQYTDVASQLGLRFRNEGTAKEAEVRQALQGELMPRRWFTDPRNRRKLVAALGSGAAFCDYNNDGRLDIFLVNANGQHALFEQRADGNFDPVTTKVKLGAEPALGMACAWGDYDNDGWADLLITGYGEIRLYRNQKGIFEDVTRTAGLARSIAPTTWSAGAAWADVDHDGDLDIYVTCVVDLSRPPEKSELRFPDDFPRQPNLLFRNNRDGTFTEIAKRAGAGGGGAVSYGVWFSDVNDDRAVDFVLFDFAGNPATFLNNRDGSFSASHLIPANLPVRPPVGESRSLGDFNRDGAVDELINKNGAVAVLNRNEVKPKNWLAVRLEGYTVPGQVKSNRMAIGAKVELRSPGRWEQKELAAGNGASGNDAPEVYFDLGDQQRVDFVRAIFPSGVRWTLRNVAANQLIKIDEPLLDVSSCPVLFAWNGERFELLTDTISAGILGELVAPGQYWQPDPDEWVRITSEQLKPSGQRLDLRFVNPLEEVTYLDQVRLLAIDHPGNLEVYPSERMVSQPQNRKPIQAYALTNFRPIVKAIDDHGCDVTARLAQSDRCYFDHFTPLPFKGFAHDWSLTLDLGARESASATVLLLQSWSYWNWSASIIAAAQAGKRLWGPSLEVLGADGRWHLGIEDLGVSAGLPRTIVIDLSQVLKPGEHRLRIRSNRTLFYDQIVTAQKVGQMKIEGQVSSARLMRASDLPLLSAQLRWLGYPRRTLPDGKLPEVYDYDHIDQQAEWGTHAGLLTRYGDVLSLLRQSDDQFVIMGNGEEVVLSFEASQLPQLPAGWQRTYLFYTAGFEKSYELHSALSESVAPLPYRAMKSYPSHEQTDRTDEGQLRYLFEWNTRPSFMRR